MTAPDYAAGFVNDKGPKPVVMWLGGWVSSLSCWETQIRTAFPEFEHRFVDTHDVLRASTPAFIAEQRARATDKRVIVAGWSLGSLRVHRWMAEGVWPLDVAVLSLCPVFRFVQPGTPGSFGESILLRMEQKLGADREAVLRDFWRRMPKADAMPPPWEAAWLEGTRRYDDESVLNALQYLRLEAADPATLATVPTRWELIAGAQDRLAMVGDWRTDLPAHARLSIHPGGHIPFWECPELIAASLKRLANLSNHQDVETVEVRS
jgi:pimeloyl-ACP methyl ester carboxylesterase